MNSHSKKTKSITKLTRESKGMVICKELPKLNYFLYNLVQETMFRVRTIDMNYIWQFVLKILKIRIIYRHKTIGSSKSKKSYIKNLIIKKLLPLKFVNI